MRRSNAAAEWLRRIMTKPCRGLGTTHAPGSNTTTGLGAPCAHCRRQCAALVGDVYSMSPMFVAVLVQRSTHTLGTPAARIASNKRQPPALDAEAIAACVA